MKKILKMTAAALAAAVFLPVFTGCSFLRPIDGTEWEETTDIPRDTTRADETKTPATTDGASETAAPATTSAPETTAPPAPKEKRASVLAVGDNIIHEAVYVDAKNRAEVILQRMNPVGEIAREVVYA